MQSTPRKPLKIFKDLHGNVTEKRESEEPKVPRTEQRRILSDLYVGRYEAEPELEPSGYEVIRQMQR
jgi:hypothetical protein